MWPVCRAEPWNKVFAFAHRPRLASSRLASPRAVSGLGLTGPVAGRGQPRRGLTRPSARPFPFSAVLIGCASACHSGRPPPIGHGRASVLGARSPATWVEWRGKACLAAWRRMPAAPRPPVPWSHLPKEECASFSPTVKWAWRSHSAELFVRIKFQSMYLPCNNGYPSWGKRDMVW